MKDKVAVGVAVVVALAYIVFVGVMWDHVDDGDADWSRRMLLFGGLEAIVFAAVGWLFGKEVNRGAVEAAEQANERANEETRERATAEQKGRTLADAVRSASEGRETARVAPPGTTSLEVLADQLFPRI